ncbi:MAG: serine hydrolase domain-containing protein [Planctomycetota bacterium]
MKSLLSLTVALLILVPGALYAQTDPAEQDQIQWTDEQTEKLDKYIESAVEEEQFNGSVLIGIDGEIVYEKVVGFRDINEEQELTFDSSFRLASVSKQFTATAIMILAEQGKLDYDDDIREYLPTIPYEGVTIRHLLHHTGGISDYMMVMGLTWDQGTPAEDKETAYNHDVVETFSERNPPVVFEPGEKQQYSNTGYVLLGQIIINVSGQSLPEFFRSEIFDKLEMTNAHVFATDDSFAPAERVFGFAFTDDGHEDNDWHYLNGMVGDGGIYASARDLLKWDQGIQENKLVSAETLQQAFTPGTTNDGESFPYGFGWVIESDEEGNTVGVQHSGGWVGFVTYIERDLETNVTVVVLSNNSGDGFGKVLRGVSSIVE